MDNHVRELTHHELSDLVTWFTHRMSMDTRHLLMGERPTLYRRMYPTVSAGAILQQVETELAADAMLRDNS